MHVVDRNLVQASIGDGHKGLTESGIRVDRKRSVGVFVHIGIDAHGFDGLFPNVGPFGDFGAASHVAPLDEVASNDFLLVIAIPGHHAVDVVQEVGILRHTEVEFTVVVEDVVDAPSALHIAETAIGSCDVVHDFLQDLALAIEAVAPSQADVRLGPVDGKHHFVGAFANPVLDFREINSGFLGQGIHGSDFLRPNIEIVDGVDQDAARFVAPLDPVAVGHCDVGVEVHGGGAVHVEHPIGASQLQVEDTVVELDVAQPATGRVIIETIVSLGDGVHDVFHRDVFFIEAVAPSQGRVGLVPVDDEHHFVFTFANPITDVGRVD